MYRENDNLNTKAVEQYMSMEPEEREKLMLKLEAEARKNEKALKALCRICAMLFYIKNFEPPS